MNVQPRALPRYCRVENCPAVEFESRPLTSVKEQGEHMEHRCGRRRSVDVPISIRTPGGLAGCGMLKDISASGALVVSPLPVALHSRVLVQLDVRLSDRPSASMRVTAEVTRLTGEGLAVEWEEFAPAAVRALMRREAQMVFVTASVDKGVGPAEPPSESGNPSHRGEPRPCNPRA